MRCGLRGQAQFEPVNTYARLLSARVGLATWLSDLPCKGWVTVLAASPRPDSSFDGYSHVDLLGAASFDLPQQVGLHCIAAALATAIAEAQLGSNDRCKRAAIRDRAGASAN